MLDAANASEASSMKPIKLAPLGFRGLCEVQSVQVFAYDASIKDTVLPSFGQAGMVPYNALKSAAAMPIRRFNSPWMEPSVSRSAPK